MQAHFHAIPGSKPGLKKTLPIRRRIFRAAGRTGDEVLVICWLLRLVLLISGKLKSIGQGGWL